MNSPSPSRTDRENASGRILYCHCAYARVIAGEVKSEVLRRLSDSGRAFDAVADLCDMSARKDPSLKRIAETGGVQIVACHARAVKWLFHAAGTPLPEEGVEILNMREESAEAIVGGLLGEDAVAREANPS